MTKGAARGSKVEKEKGRWDEGYLVEHIIKLLSLDD